MNPSGRCGLRLPPSSSEADVSTYCAQLVTRTGAFVRPAGARPTTLGGPFQHPRLGADHYLLPGCIPLVTDTQASHSPAETRIRAGRAAARLPSRGRLGPVNQPLHTGTSQESRR